MPSQDQLEIIDPQGRIRFYPLDSSKGITNIGRHIDNDIVINRPGVAPFHAMLDHRTKPYTLVVLARREKTTLDNEPAPINTPTPLASWASMEIGGHQIIFLAGDKAEEPEPPLAADGEASVPESAAQLAEASPTSAPSDIHTPSPPPDPTSALTLEYSARALVVEAGQTGTLDLTLINGGYKPILFLVGCDGLDPTWVSVTPAEIEIPSRQRATVTIIIAPPHQPATRAGAYTATITVTTPQYPDWKNQARIALTINPYSDFLVSELSPRAQSLYWSQPFAQAAFEVVNRGNSETVFRISGEDERYACRYEFKLSDDSVAQHRQAELRLAPGASGRVTVRITPLTRYRAGWSARRHYCAITVAPQGGMHLPRTVLGEVREQPLVGRLALSLIGLLLIGLAAFVLRPTIAVFNATPTHITAGQETVLAWSASPFAGLRISPDVGRVPGPDGRLTLTPTKDTLYTLIAENFLSFIYPDWFRATRQIAVLVDPVLPSILFTTDSDTIPAGESVTLSWQVADAEELILNINGVPEAIPLGQFTSSRAIELNANTTFVLQARNQFTTADGVSATLLVHVIPGTPAPQPTRATQPIIDRFEISPAEITAGEQVTIYWSVSGVDKVVIEPLAGEFPPSGNVVVSPPQTIAYVLTASSGNTPVKLVKTVVVNPAPGAPLIDTFTATPREVAPDSPESQAVKLAWSITGETTDIQLSGPGLGPAVNLPKQGELTTPVNTTATFTLIALNGSLSSVQTVQVNVTSPAPTVVNIAPASATAGNVPFTLTVIGANFVSGSVVQWNGSPRSTTYAGPTQLLAAINSADLATAGTANVTVFNPAPGGGLSSALPFTVNNPAPVITSISPNSTAAGGVAFALTINGNGFNTQTIVRWNGSNRTISSVSPTQITFLVSAGDIASAGTATISVVNPVPGGGSDAAIFTINAATPTPAPTAPPTETPPASPMP